MGARFVALIVVVVSVVGVSVVLVQGCVQRFTRAQQVEPPATATTTSKLVAVSLC